MHRYRRTPSMSRGHGAHVGHGTASTSTSMTSMTDMTNRTSMASMIDMTDMRTGSPSPLAARAAAAASSTDTGVFSRGDVRSSSTYRDHGSVIFGYVWPCLETRGRFPPVEVGVERMAGEARWQGACWAGWAGGQEGLGRGLSLTQAVPPPAQLAGYLLSCILS